VPADSALTRVVVVAPRKLENAEAGTGISEMLSLGLHNYTVYLPNEYKISGFI